MTTLTLTDFLLARIADDEAAVAGVGLGPRLRRLFVAEHEAARRIVGLHPEILGICQGCAHESYPCRTLLALALPYADHPDYREEWNPAP